MNTKSCTNIEQSRKLIAAGVDESTADLFITPKVGGYVVSTERAANSEPSWSVVALYDMLPTSITYDGSSYVLRSSCKPFCSCCYEGGGTKRIMDFKGWDDLVDMLTEAVLWFMMAKDELSYERNQV